MIKDVVYKDLIQFKSKKIILALSGGLDSVVLLDILNSLNIDLDIHLIHINYNQHRNSNKAFFLCKKLASIYKNKFISYKANVGKRNFESKARNFRYSKMKKYGKLNNINLILTAHHLDDQIETIFMQQMLNSDWISKIGIRKKNENILRPLLSVHKDEIRKYAVVRKLTWIEDSTNNNVKFFRNKVRHELLPFYSNKHYNLKDELLMIADKSLNKFNHLIKTIYFDFNSNLCITKNFIQIDNCIIDKYSIIEMKLFYQILIKNNFNQNIRKSKSFWNELYNFLLNANSGSFFYLNNQIIISKDRCKHFLYEKKYLENIKLQAKNRKLKINKFPFLWNEYIIKKLNNIELSNSTFTIPLDIYKKGLFVRRWRKGDVCYSEFYKKNIKLKKIFINNKVSLIDKYNLPIITDANNNIVCVPNLYSRYESKENFVRFSYERNQ